MGDDDKPGKTQDELKASISEKKDVWTAKPNGTVGLLERSQVYGVRQVKDCLVDMLAYAADLEQGLVLYRWSFLLYDENFQGALVFC